MSFTEQDLRDALQPLAGDPVRDAAWVLDALPAPKPPLPPATWWFGGAGILLGLLLGMAAGFALGGEDAEPVAAEPQQVEPQQEKPPEKPPAMPMEMDIYLMAFGELTVVEPGLGRQTIAPGQHGLMIGAEIETGEEALAGLHVPIRDVRLRLDRGTVARVVSPLELELTRGRIFVQSGEATEGQIEVSTPEGLVLLQDGAVQIASWPGELSALVTEGRATVRTGAGEIRPLEAGQRLRLDRTGLRTENVAFLGTETSWMTEMIRLQQDGDEWAQRVRAMVWAYEDGTHRDAAELEIRKIGSNSVALLVYSVQNTGIADEAYRRRTAELAAAVADYRTSRMLLPLLANDDPEVRVAIHRGLEHISGLDAGMTEEFWRTATPGDRQQGIARWREALQ